MVSNKVQSTSKIEQRPCHLSTPGKGGRVKGEKFPAPTYFTVWKVSIWWLSAPSSEPPVCPFSKLPSYSNKKSSQGSGLHLLVSDSSRVAQAIKVHWHFQNCSPYPPDGDFSGFVSLPCIQGSYSLVWLSHGPQTLCRSPLLYFCSNGHSNPNYMSFMSFICHIHNTIQSRLIELQFWTNIRLMVRDTDATKAEYQFHGARERGEKNA